MAIFRRELQYKILFPRGGTASWNCVIRWKSDGTPCFQEAAPSLGTAFSEGNHMENLVSKRRRRLLELLFLKEIQWKTLFPRGGAASWNCSFFSKEIKWKTLFPRGGAASCNSFILRKSVRKPCYKRRRRLLELLFSLGNPMANLVPRGGAASWNCFPTEIK